AGAGAARVRACVAGVRVLKGGGTHSGEAGQGSRDPAADPLALVISAPLDQQDQGSKRQRMSEQNLAARVRAALDAGEGILRLAPTWVPRSFLMPGGRLKLAREDLYALGTHRGGIDERWFASTTPAANEGAPPDEGLSYAVSNGDRFTLKDAIELFG